MWISRWVVAGVHHSMPASVNGEMDVDALFGGSNVGVPGLYIFNITGGTPSETQYPAIEGGWSCPREATPNECHLYSHNQQVLTLKGFFCDSAALPTSDAIQIVFQGLPYEWKFIYFPFTARWTPNKQFCFSKSAPFGILSSHSKPWYHICSQVGRQWWTWSCGFKVTCSRSQRSDCSPLLFLF